MNCLEKYRQQLVRNLNHDLRGLYQGADEKAVHDFRVGIKRLSALFYFLNRIDPGIESKKLLKPYRALFKAIGKIRDAHIAVELLRGHDLDFGTDTRHLIAGLQAKIERDYGEFSRSVDSASRISIRTPTLAATGISQRAILAHKPLVQSELLGEVLQADDMMTAKRWHKKRILLKRYHHILDAFQFCPGHSLDEAEFKQIRILEQLLGDWHDRVITTEILRDLPKSGGRIDNTVAAIYKQHRFLLGAARIYLHKYARWHAMRQPAGVNSAGTGGLNNPAPGNQTF